MLNFGVDLSAFKDFDYRSLKKYMDPKASEDFNRFLEDLPKNTGQTILIVAGVVWAVAGALGLYTSVQVKELTSLRAELENTKALKPPVPKIVDVAVNRDEVEKFAEEMRNIYRGINITGKGSTITITASSTGNYAEFREAIGHVQNGGSGWRVSVESLCVGRECARNPLSASLKINKVSVKNAG